MPGNEVGDRIHNFFGQEDLSQDQQRSEVVDGTWPGLGNNLWAGSQRQVGTSFISNLKNQSVQQSDPERGHGGQSSSVQHGVDFSHSILRPEFARVQSHNQQPTLNGYMHGSQAFQTKQNDANFLGVDTESDQLNLTSRGVSVMDAQLGTGPDIHRKNSLRMDFNESPVNFDFFGGQQQLNSQHPGMLQPLPRQQSGFRDMNPLLQSQVLQEIQRQQFQQQKVMLEMQRQEQHQKQQLKQQELRRLNSGNHVSPFAKQAAGCHPQALVNGIPVHDPSNYSWQSELVAANANWQHRGASPALQGTSSGLMFSPDQAQAPRMMGMIPQQVEQSLYGVPVSGTKVAASQYSPGQLDKSPIQQISASNNPFSGNQYAAFTDQACMQDVALASRQGYKGKHMIGTSDSEGLNGRFDMENLQEVDPQQRNVSGQDFNGRQNLADPGASQEKTFMHVTPSQNVATLDPTEEKILFGSDDNLWEAFGKGGGLGSGGFNMLDGADLFGALPSVQSGSWSALMQSAVAETSSADTGMQEEWSGPTFRSNEPPAGNQQNPALSDGGKHQSTWVDDKLKSACTPNARPYKSDGTNSSIDNNNMPEVKQSGVSTSQERGESLYAGSSRVFQPWLDHSSGVKQSGVSTSQERSESLYAGSSRVFQPRLGHNGVKQSGVSTSQERSESLYAGSSRVPQPWLDHNSLQRHVSEGGYNFEKGAHSSQVESNAKSVSGSWTNQQNISSYNSASQPGNRPNGWKLVDSASSGAGTDLKNQGNDKMLQASQSIEHKNPMFEGMNYGDGTWKTDSVSHSIVKLEQGKKSIMGSPHMTKEDSNLNNVAALPDSSSYRANQESGQQLPNGNNIDIWKHVDSSTNPRRRDFPGIYQPHVDRNSNILELSGNNSLGNGAVEAHDSQDANERNIDAFRNSSHCTSSSGVRDGGWLDANDSLSLSGVKLKSSSQTGRKPSGVRKFQYHPMGDLDADVEPSYGTKHVTQSKSMSVQVSQGLKGHGYRGNGQSKFPTQLATNSMEIEKGSFPNFHGEVKGLEEITTTNVLPGSAPSTSASFDRVDYKNATSKAMPSSQNMLELLHKVDQSREHGNAIHFSSSDCNQTSETHDAKSSDGSVHIQQKQSSTSQGFGLQLGPPSQLLPNQDQARASWGPSETTNSLTSTHGSSEVGEKSHRWLASTSSVHGLPPHEMSQGELRNSSSCNSGQTGKNGQANFSAAFSPGFPYARSHFQNQHMRDIGGQATTSLSVNAYFDRFSSQSKQMESFERAQCSESLPVPDMSRSSSRNDITSSSDMLQESNNNQNSVKDSSQQFPVLEAMSAPQENASARTSPNAWSSISTQQHSFVVQTLKASSNMFNSNLQSNIDLETNSSRPQRPEGHNIQLVGTAPSESGAYSREHQPAKGDPGLQISPEINQVQNLSALEGKESVANSHMSTPVCNSMSTQKEIEAFGQDLRPNDTLHQNISLMHQMQGMKNADVDPSNRSLKRFKGPDSAVDAEQVGPQGGQQQYGHNNMVGEALVNRASIPPGDPKVLSFSAKPANFQSMSTPSQDMAAFGQNDPQNTANSGTASLGAEHTPISPQMAPSWFDQYGTFKNGQVLPLHDARRNTAMKTLELPFPVGRSTNSLHAHALVNAVAADSTQHSILQKGSSPSPVASENLSSPQLMHHDVADVSLAALRPKKRKTATSELVPWDKQVVHGLQRLQNMSLAEFGWARATNRLTEKVEEETDIVEDVPPVFRSKRRLIFTTQLMQLLFHPPLPSVLSADATLHHQNVVHSLSRSTLGDACGSLSCAASDTHTPVPSTSGKIPSKKLKASERISNQYFSKVVEDLINRSKKLENDILRLDKRASVLDLRVECQELEKYSVINRFAKFHGRNQADGAETSLASDSPMNAQKSCPQRYVTALPMPRNLPDRESDQQKKKKKERGKEERGGSGGIGYERGPELHGSNS